MKAETLSPYDYSVFADKRFAFLINAVIPKDRIKNVAPMFEENVDSILIPRLMDEDFEFKLPKLIDTESINTTEPFISSLNAAELKDYISIVGNSLLFSKEITKI